MAPVAIVVPDDNGIVEFSAGARTARSGRQDVRASLYIQVHSRAYRLRNPERCLEVYERSSRVISPVMPMSCVVGYGHQQRSAANSKPRSVGELKLTPGCGLPASTTSAHWRLPHSPHLTLRSSLRWVGDGVYIRCDAAARANDVDVRQGNRFEEKNQGRYVASYGQRQGSSCTAVFVDILTGVERTNPGASRFTSSLRSERGGLRFASAAIRASVWDGS